MLFQENQKFKDLKIILNRRDKDSLRMQSNGGNTILFLYPPKEEKEYLQKIKEIYNDAYLIDIAEIFVDYIDSLGFENFIELYEDYLPTPEELFKSKGSEDDFFFKILEKIKEAGRLNKIPFIIRTGALYGTGIENINIMDSKVVKDLPVPLVIMYPAEIEKNNKIKFLGFKIASDYRAIVIS